MSLDEPTTNTYQGLTESQLTAIDKYQEQISIIDDPVKLRQRCIDMYAQSLRMHNTYLQMLEYQAQMQQAYQKQSD